MIKSILIYSLILISISVFANSVTGIIIDENNIPLPGANVFVKGSILGSASDKDGFFRINNLPDGNFILVISVVGFNEKNIEIDNIDHSEINLGEIQLVSFPLSTSPIFVTASKHQQNIKDIPVSIASIDKMEIEIRNSVTLDKALQYVPGIHMNQDQISIRGSSGYSRGIGSRVMMLIDGVPFITGDTQGIVPEALAINQVENVEVVKGAASTLYGSNAMGGVINVITKSVESNPVINLKMYGGLYDNPYYNQWKWWSGSRFIHGLKTDYSNKFKNTGVRLAFSQDKDDSYKKNNWSNRINVGGKLEHEFSAYDKLSISGNFMDQKRGNFLYWKDLQNALVPLQSSNGEKIHSIRYFINPSFRKILSDSNFYFINAIWFHNYFDDNIEAGNNSTSDNFNISSQYNISVNMHFLTFGLNAEYNKVSANIFGNRKGYNSGVFLQDEMRWNEEWFTTFGARFDYFDIDKLGSGYSINPKFGAVFQVNPYTTFRSSLGTGYRFPSMAEAFTSTTASGIIVIPNEKLKPERSYSGEVGYNQIISNQVNLDIALFYNRYMDYIESGFTENYQARFDNIPKAEIAGIDASLQFMIFNKLVQSRLGYTFIEPRDISNDKSEYLKYRPRHLLYSNTNFLYKDFVLGVDYRYLSEYDKIDNEFTALITDGEEKIAVHVVDIRASQKINLGSFPLTISLQVNNLLQYNYIDFIASISPIRHFVLTLDTTF